MAKVYKGRWTARPSETDLGGQAPQGSNPGSSSPYGSFVVFLIGMRVNRLLAVHRWAPVAAAMGPMLRELGKHPELGFLGGMSSIGGRGVMVTQYWRSFDHLMAYAQQKGGLHMAAWQAFYRRAAKSEAVGIWHETYKIESGASECVYVNMPRTGLAMWSRHVPAEGHLHDARARMRVNAS